MQPLTWIDNLLCTPHQEQCPKAVGTSELIDSFFATAPLASVVSVGLSQNDVPTVDKTVGIVGVKGTKKINVDVVIPFHSDSCKGAVNEELAACIGSISRFSKLCKDGKGTVTMSDPSAKQLGLSYTACMKTDQQDGLHMTVVCTQSGEALGLVHSSTQRSIVFDFQFNSIQFNSTPTPQCVSHCDMRSKMAFRNVVC